VYLGRSRGFWVVCAGILIHYAALNGKGRELKVGPSLFITHGQSFWEILPANWALGSVGGFQYLNSWAIFTKDF
jgi:hypothetical protein